LKGLRARPAEPGPGEPGSVVTVDGDGILVACGGGSRLRLLSVQPEIRKAMPAASFAAGARLSPGGLAGLGVPTPAPRLALDVLVQVGRGRATLADLLAAPEIEGLAPRERAFLHELVLGSLRGRGALDHTLARLSTRPLEGLHPGVRNALRLGAHQ